MVHPDDPLNVCPGPLQSLAVPTGASHSNVCGRLRLAVIAAVVVVGSLFLASPAQASCGNYIRIESHTTPSTAFLAQNSLDPSDSPFGPVPPAPCQGPNCSRRPDQAPLAPVPPAPSLPDLSAWLPHSLLVSVDGKGFHVANPADFCPFGFPFRLDRPPRS